MDLGHRVAAFAGRLIAPIRAGNDKLAITNLERGRTFPVCTSAFEDGGKMPDRLAGKHAEAPDVSWGPPPDGTRELVILCEDPDAPLPRPFSHWVVYGVPPTATSLPAGGDAPRVEHSLGKNSRGKLGYAGAAPPPGHGLHHYHFEVFALDAALPLPPGADRDSVVAAMKGHVLASGEVVGTYEVA